MGIGAAVGAAFGLKEIASYVKGSMDASDATHDMAERLGTSTEALQKLQYVAKVSGVDNETLTGSLEKMNLRLAEVATEGSGPAAEALRHFGLSARDLAEQSPVESFRTLIGMIGGIANPAERAKVSVDLFGKSGQAMIQVAAQGKDGIAALEQEFVALGGSISDVDSEKIAEANDAIDRAGVAVQGLGNQLAVQLSSYITHVADLFVDWAKEGGRAGSIVSQGIDWVVTAIGYAADAIQFFETGFFGLRSVALGVLSKISEGISAVMKDLSKIMDSGWVRAVAPALGAAWDLMDSGQKKALTDSSGFFKAWADDLAGESARAGERAAAAWDKPWAHVGVRNFVDDFQLKAQQRAQLAAGKEGEFARGGHLEHPKVIQPEFAGALQMGSKEAYSAVLKSKAMLQNSVQNRIEVNTRTAAEASTRTAVNSARMLQLMENRTRDGQQGREMAGVC